MAKSHIKTAKHGMPFESSERLLHGFQRFASNNAAGGILLISATLAALVWANIVGAESYRSFFHGLYIDLEVGGWHVPHIHSIAAVINEFLMAIFFLFVGLEIKREVVQGELRDPKQAALPIAGAIGGMVVPAVIYAAVNGAVLTAHGADGAAETMSGWGIPMATDIAFALGVLMLLGRRAPLPLKVFLTSLAIVDDLGALLVIALFYTEQLRPEFLALASLTFGLLWGINILRFRHPLFYIVPGIALWVFVLSSGVHATIAGVLLALTIPTGSRVDARRFIDSTRAAVDHFERRVERGATPQQCSEQRAAAYCIRENVAQAIPTLHRMEYALQGWCVFLIIPVFALANAGVRIERDVAMLAADPVTVGVFFGLVLGKPLGVVGACFVACRCGLAALPSGVSWRHMIGAGCLAGIGFTMALFIANLAFGENAGHLNAAKMGILSASLVATVAGVTILLLAKPVARPVER